MKHRLLPLLFLLGSCCGGAGVEFTVVTGRNMPDSLSYAVTDLQRYIAAALPKARVSLSSDGGGSRGHLIVLVDRQDQAVSALCDRHGMEETSLPWNSFSIRTASGKAGGAGTKAYFLEGADILGRQYAVYDFAERLLGVKYLKPDYDHVPRIRRFRAAEINTGVQAPDYRWRGLYPWLYNYNRRGTENFCDLNARFEAGDWEWFRSLGDWMVKNKQNLFLWFDDVFSHQNISWQFPVALSDYYAFRGLYQLLGLGWASNEDLQAENDFDRPFCTDIHGHSIEDASWKRSICPACKEYFRLADKNLSRLRTDRPDRYPGLLIGYGENTWATREEGVGCVRHSGTPSSQFMLRDLSYVRNALERKGLGDMPVGFVTSTYSIRKGNPFETDEFLDRLPRNAFFTMHTYQSNAWTQFEGLYRKIAVRNAEGAKMKVFHIAEGVFLCGADIPILKPSVLRRRSEHYNTLPRENTVGHLATLNTTQYGRWFEAWRMMRWQWHKDGTRWDVENREIFGSVFGNRTGEKVNEVFNRLLCLDHVLAYEALDSLKNTAPELRAPVQWRRYDPSRHPEDFGFVLWAGVRDRDTLEGALESLKTIRRLNGAAAAESQFYKDEFYKIVLLTASYYELRVRVGLSLLETASLEEKRSEAACALTCLKDYRDALHDLMPGDTAGSWLFNKDFLFNPSEEYLQGLIE